MKSWKNAIAAAMLSVAAPMVVLYIAPSVWTMALLFLWIAGVLAAVQIWNTRHYERERKAQELSLQQASIRTLNHHRHDWMNELQVLYGYIQLGKPDKSVQCVERIRERMAVDSRISKLGIPALVFYLQSFRTFGGSLQLEVEIEEELQLAGRMKPEDGEELASMVSRIVRAYQYGGLAPQGESRKLVLSFREENGDLIVGFTAFAPSGSESMLKQQLDSILDKTKWKAEQKEPGGASFQLRLPLK